MPKTSTLAHVCDRCDARALVLFVNNADLNFSFCGHHANRHEVALLLENYRVVEDGREEAQRELIRS